jgi:hypothetical protein
MVQPALGSGWGVPSVTAEIACAVLSYRDEPFLVEAVRSLLEQSVPVEVVVVNSGGGDPRPTARSCGIEPPGLQFR